jgi:hypothetical protein
VDSLDFPHSARYPSRVPRVTKQIHIPQKSWEAFDKRVGPRNRSSGTDALYRALDAGDVKNFDEHHAAVRTEITNEQVKRLRKNRDK